MKYELTNSYKFTPKLNNQLGEAQNDIQITFRNGAKVEILGPAKESYEIKFIDRFSGATVYTTKIGNNMWCSPNTKYYVDWKIEVYRDGKLIKEDGLKLKNQRVKIVIDSNSMGDAIAFIGAVNEFQKRHDCILDCVVFNADMRTLFEKSYPNINFKKVNESDEAYYAVYKLGWFNDWDGLARHDPRSISLAHIAGDILGLSLTEFKPELVFNREKKHSKKKYVCIAVQSTSQYKYWNNPNGWNSVVKYLNSAGYEVWCIDRDSSFGIKDHMNYIPKGAIDKTGKVSLETRMEQINGAEFFIGLSSGLSWLAWAINKPVILISGMSMPWLEFYTPHRIINKNVCHGCCNDTNYLFDKNDWLYCPRKKNFECTTSISAEMVIEEIENLRNGKTKFDFERFFRKYRSGIEASGVSRLRFYEHVIPKLVALGRPIHVLETGTMWAPFSDNMGAFTLIMADLIHNYTGGKLYTVDISEKSLNNCKEYTKEFADSIEYVLSDSVAYLKNLPDEFVGSLDLVYLDSYDLYVPKPHDSAQHHLNELMAVYDRLSPNCPVAIDDNFLPNTFIIWKWYNDDGTFRNSERFDFKEVMGKGMYCHKFLLDAGWKRFSEFDVHGGSNLFYYERGRLPKDKVTRILESFYDKVGEKKPTTTKFLGVNNIKNSAPGLGDAVVMTALCPEKTIAAAFPCFSELAAYVPGFSSASPDAKWHDVDTSDLVDFDWGGGHCIQRLQKAFTGKFSTLPKSCIRAERNETKRFVATHFATTSERNKQNSLPQEAVDAILSFLSSNGYTVFRCESIKSVDELVRTLAACEFFIGIDSGPMHIAAGLGVKSVIILNREDSNKIYLPKLKEASIPNSEWLYPQNVHLSMQNKNELVEKFSVSSLKLALEGKLYPYFSTDYLDLAVTAVLDKWSFEPSENKLNFSFKRNITNCTVVLKDLTTNLTCYHWAAGDISAGTTLYISPLRHIKLLDTDFSGFILNVYENGVKISKEVLRVRQEPKAAFKFYSDDTLDMTVQDAFYVQYADFYHSEFLNSVVQRGDAIIDVGASCGTFARAALMRGASKVICLEPSPSFEILQKSFGSEVRALNVALDTNVCEKEFCFTNQTTLNTFDIDTQKKYDSAKLITEVQRKTVKCIDLKTLLATEKLTKVGLLKVDIEGYEYEIFKAINPIDLAPVGKVLIEFHHNDSDQIKIIESKLIEAGFVVSFLNLAYEQHDSRKDLQGIIYASKQPTASDDMGVIYKGTTDDGLGINFDVKNSSPRKIDAVISDTFTNLVFHRETMQLNKANPGTFYFIKHAYRLPNQSFRFYDKETGKLLLERIINTNGDMDVSHFLESNRNLSSKVPDNLREHRALGYSFFEIYHRNTYNMMGCGINKGDVVFDLGANVGMFARYAFQMGAAEVHSFEPNALLAECYSSLNKGHKYYLNIGAVYSKPIAFKSELDTDILGLQVTEPTADLPDVHINFNEYVAKQNIKHIDYLKVDIEGAEYDLFETMPDSYLRDSVSKVVLEYHENENGSKLKPITDKLSRCGFDVRYEYGDGATRSLGMLYASKL